jgi:hypothetical protein
VFAYEVDMGAGLLIVLLGLACFASLLAAAVVLIVWAARRSSRPTRPVDFDEPRGSAGPPDTQITR